MTSSGRPWLSPGRAPWIPRPPWWRTLRARTGEAATAALLDPRAHRPADPFRRWPTAGGGWEGGTVTDGRRLYHEPWVGWRDDGPARQSPPPDPGGRGRVYRDPGTATRRACFGRWVHRRRHGAVALTALAVVTGYAAVLVGFFDRTMPTMRSAAALVTAGMIGVAVLLGVILWAHRD